MVKGLVKVGGGLYELPRVPSELLLISFRDVMYIHNRTDIDLKMSTWYSTCVGYEENAIKANVCSVCLAGSVMYRTVYSDLDYVSYDRDYVNTDCYLFIDYCRLGLMKMAMECFCIECPEGVDSFLIDRGEWINNLTGSIGYNVCNDMEGFKSYMRRLINELRRIGL